MSARVYTFEPYLSNAQHRTEKARLTRARNTGDPIAVLAACERTLDAWEGYVWPDDWHTWAIAVQDAYTAYRMQNGNDSPAVSARFHDCLWKLS